MQPRPEANTAKREAGAIFLEFALVLLVLYILLFGALELGRAIFGGQLVQDAARVAARELALVPLPPEATFDEALQDPRVRSQVYDPDYLVVDLAAVSGDLDDFFAGLPLVNQMLRPLMIVDSFDDSGGGAQRRLLRYPGALLSDSGSVTGYTVQIPKVVSRDGDGVETIVWIPVVEEVKPASQLEGPFSILPSGDLNLPRGVVALRINYPYQAAALSGFRSSPDGPFEKNMNLYIEARDSQVVALNSPLDGASVLADDAPAGVYAGPYGLGRQLAIIRTLRPFRKLISAQAVFRREVFQ